MKNKNGIQINAAKNQVLLISKVDSVYDDHIGEDVFLFDGMGQVGDQTWNTENTFLRDSKINHATVWLILPRKGKRASPIKVVLDSYRNEQRPDKTGMMRKVIVFVLKKV
ncbi:MAG: hypothetical protein LBM78_02580 [Clostridiales bacterium]|jgi:hypothetical protein|nr:hypothetical protein [Clostridiales bacterium]